MADQPVLVEIPLHTISWQSSVLKGNRQESGLIVCMTLAIRATFAQQCLIKKKKEAVNGTGEEAEARKLFFGGFSL